MRQFYSAAIFSLLVGNIASAQRASDIAGDILADLVASGGVCEAPTAAKLGRLQRRLTANEFRPLTSSVDKSVLVGLVLFERAAQKFAGLSLQQIRLVGAYLGKRVVLSASGHLVASFYLGWDLGTAANDKWAMDERIADFLFENLGPI